jgi:hypothetical protein
VAVGPLFPEADVADRRNPTEEERELHNRDRDIVAALERDLAVAMATAGYRVLNEVNSTVTVSPELWAKVRAEFADKFALLRSDR